MKTIKFKPNLAFCAGCIYFDPDARNDKLCRRFTGYRVGYKHGVQYCIVKDDSTKLF